MVYADTAQLFYFSYLAHLSRARGQCVYFVGLKPAEMLKVSLATLSPPLERVC